VLWHSTGPEGGAGRSPARGGAEHHQYCEASSAIDPEPLVSLSEAYL